MSCFSYHDKFLILLMNLIGRRIFIGETNVNSMQTAVQNKIYIKSIIMNLLEAFVITATSFGRREKGGSNDLGG